MNDREYILAGNDKLLDSLIQNRDDWKKRSKKLEKLLSQIAVTTNRLSDSPLSFLATMQEFSKNWKNDRENYLGI